MASLILVGCSESMADQTKETATENEQTKEEQSDNKTGDVEFENVESIALSSAEQTVNDALNGFSVDYFANVSRAFDKIYPGQSDGNFAVSPISAALCMDILANSTDNATAAAISQMMGYADIESLNSTCQKLMQYLPSSTNGAVMALANSAWISQFINVADSYKKSIKGLLNADVYSVNFLDAATTDAMNKWCSDNTNGLLNNVIGKVDPQTVAMLFNALYFSGEWNTKFDKDKSVIEPFHGIAGDTDATMMKASQNMKYAAVDDCQSLVIPFSGESMQLLLVMPDNGVNISEFNNSLSSQKYQEILAAMDRCEVTMSMPRFEVRSSGTVGEALHAMGLPQSASLDMIGDNSKSVSVKVQQDTYTAFDEEGGKVAAVTCAYEGTATGESVEYKKVSVDFNRPFIYMVRNTITGSIIMAGRVCNI